MAHHNQEETQLSLYEGDQSTLYSREFNTHRYEDVKSEASKKTIRKIWTITLWLAFITILEIGQGLWNYVGSPIGHNMSIALFIIMTLIKAYLIIDIFMHLGDELRTFVYAVAIPMIFFIWFIIGLLADGSFWLKMNHTQGYSLPEVEQHDVTPPPAQ